MSLNQPAIKFGYYSSAPQPYSFWGQSGWFSVPSGRSWYQVIDAGMQNWVSPNPITKNADGSVSGDPLFAAELNCDGTLVYQDHRANTGLGITSPPPTWLSVRIAQTSTV